MDHADAGLPGGDYLIRVTAPIEHWSHTRLHHTMAELLLPEVEPICEDRR